MATRARNFRLLASIIVPMVAALIIFGCGGGSGGGGGTGATATGTTSTTTGTIVGVQLVPVYAGTNSPAPSSTLMVNGKSTTVYQFATGDTIQFDYIGSESNNSTVHKIVSGGPVTITSNRVTSLSGSTLTVLSPSNGATYVVSGSYNGSTLNDTVLTVAKLAQVSGLVEDRSGNPVYGIPITFTGPSGTVGTTTTGIDGTFIGEVPANSTGFEADFSSFTTYYNEYLYNGLNYTPTITGCFTPLPTLAVGSRVPLPNPVVPYFFDVNTPAPPPTGCG